MRLRPARPGAAPPTLPEVPVPHASRFTRPVALAFLAALAGVALAAQQAEPPRRQPIYDPQADVKALTDAALRTAKAENRRVLLMFGANWCPWCHKLHALFREDAQVSACLKKHYVLVMVDVGETREKLLNRELVNRFGIRDYGVPSLVVLDADGRTLCTQSTGVLEKGGAHDPDKVLQFLSVQVAAPPPESPPAP